MLLRELDKPGIVGNTSARVDVAVSAAFNLAQCLGVPLSTTVGAIVPRVPGSK
jgi:hypothetical protein